MSRTAEIQTKVVQGILDCLRSGTIPWVKPWRSLAPSRPAFGGLFLNRDRNGISDRPYTGINTLILWAASATNGWTGNRWCTFNQAKKAGGSVRKGEKGTQIIFWNIKEVEERDETGRPQIKKLFFLRTFTVFNECQVDGVRWPSRPVAVVDAPAPAPEAPANEFQVLVHAEATIDATGAEITYGGDRAYYNPALDYIRLPNREDFQTSDHYYATAFHELAHWTGHSSRLDRLQETNFGSQVYGYEELVAELASAFLCASHGVDGLAQHQAAYLDSWIKAIEERPDVLFKAAKEAAAAAAWIQPEEEEEGSEEEEVAAAA